MENINLPPFYVGQRVVAIHNAVKDNAYKMGDEKVVLAVLWHCKEWFINVGIPTRIGIGTKCPHCQTRMNSDFIWYCYARHFAPIQENFQSISLEKILEKETSLISSN